MNHSVFIVEDNLSYFLELKLLLAELNIPLVGHADNSVEATGKILELEPDLIFMDIDIKGNLRGTQVADKIKHLNIPILFLTSFPSKTYYEEAANYSNFLFLAKPIEKYTLLSSIEILMDRQQAQEEQVTKAEEGFLFLKNKQTFFKIFFKDILFVTSEGNYCKIQTEEKLYMDRMKISDLYEKLPEYFIKAHRSYIVNGNKISSVSLQDLEMDIEGHRIPIASSYKSGFTDLVKKI